MNKDLQGSRRSGRNSAARPPCETTSQAFQPGCKLENSLGKDLTGLAGYRDRNKAELTR